VAVPPASSTAVLLLIKVVVVELQMLLFASAFASGGQVMLQIENSEVLVPTVAVAETLLASIAEPCV